MDHDQISLIYNKFGDTNIDHYNIYAGPDESPLELLTTTTVPYVELTSLDSDTYYVFQVTAVDTQGNESAPSDIVEAVYQLCHARQQPGP